MGTIGDEGSGGIAHSLDPTTFKYLFEIVALS